MRYPWTSSDHGHAVNVRGSRADLVRWLGEPSEEDPALRAPDGPEAVWGVVPRSRGWMLTRRLIFLPAVPAGAIWPTRLRTSSGLREWMASLEGERVRVGCTTVPLRQLADLVTARESLLTSLLELARRARRARPDAFAKRRTHTQNRRDR